MKIPRDLSGHDLAEALRRDWGYIRIHQVGSHIILQTHAPTPHRIAVPNHAALRIGTLNNIVRSVARHKGVDRQLVLQSLR